MKTIEQAAKEHTAIEVNIGCDTDALFISRIGIKQLLNRTFKTGAEFANERIVKLLTLFENDLFHKFYSSVDYSSRIEFIKDWESKNLK